MTVTKADLSVAVNRLDHNYASDAGGVEMWCSDHDVSPDDLAEMAVGRCGRGVMKLLEWEPTRENALRILDDAHGRNLLGVLAGAWVDGFSTGFTVPR